MTELTIFYLLAGIGEYTFFSQHMVISNLFLCLCDSSNTARYSRSTWTLVLVFERCVSDCTSCETKVLGAKITLRKTGLLTASNFKAFPNNNTKVIKLRFL